jgi:transposase-like protein
MEALAMPNQETEVLAKAKRRKFTAKEKLRILRLADACKDKSGDLGALLRKEGIYSSSLANWRKARERGELDGLTPKKRGPQTAATDPRDERIAELERALAKSDARAKRAEALVEVQKKVSVLLGIALPASDEVPS